MYDIEKLNSTIVGLYGKQLINSFFPNETNETEDEIYNKIEHLKDLFKKYVQLEDILISSRNNTSLEEVLREIEINTPNFNPIIGISFLNSRLSSLESSKNNISKRKYNEEKELINVLTNRYIENVQETDFCDLNYNKNGKEDYRNKISSFIYIMNLYGDGNGFHAKIFDKLNEINPNINFASYSLSSFQGANSFDAILAKPKSNQNSVHQIDSLKKYLKPEYLPHFAQGTIPIEALLKNNSYTFDDSIKSEETFDETIPLNKTLFEQKISNSFNADKIFDNRINNNTFANLIDWVVNIEESDNLKEEKMDIFFSAIDNFSNYVKTLKKTQTEESKKELFKIFFALNDVIFIHPNTNLFTSIPDFMISYRDKLNELDFIDPKKLI